MGAAHARPQLTRGHWVTRQKILQQQQQQQQQQ